MKLSPWAVTVLLIWIGIVVLLVHAADCTGANPC